MVKVEKIKEGIEIGYDTYTKEIDFICEYCSQYNDYYTGVILKDFKDMNTTDEVIKSLRNITDIQCQECDKYNKVIGAYAVF